MAIKYILYKNNYFNLNFRDRGLNNNIKYKVHYKLYKTENSLS